MSFGGVPVAHLLGDDDMVAASTILVPLARDREIARWRPLEGGSPLTLIALAKDVSFLNIQDPQLQDRRRLSQARSQSPISQCHKRVRLLAIVRPDSLPSSRLPGRATLSRGAICRRRRWRQSRCAPTDRPLVDASRRSPRLPSGAVRGSGIRWSGKNSTCDHLPPSVKFDVRGRLPVSGLHRSTPV